MGEIPARNHDENVVIGDGMRSHGEEHPPMLVHESPHNEAVYKGQRYSRPP